MEELADAEVVSKLIVLLAGKGLLQVRHATPGSVFSLLQSSSSWVLGVPVEFEVGWSVTAILGLSH